MNELVSVPFDFMAEYRGQFQVLTNTFLQADRQGITSRLATEPLGARPFAGREISLASLNKILGTIEGTIARRFTQTNSIMWLRLLRGLSGPGIPQGFPPSQWREVRTIAEWMTSRYAIDKRSHGGNGDRGTDAGFITITPRQIRECVRLLALCESFSNVLRLRRDLALGADVGVVHGVPFSSFATDRPESVSTFYERMDEGASSELGVTGFELLQPIGNTTQPDALLLTVAELHEVGDWAAIWQHVAGRDVWDGSWQPNFAYLPRDASRGLPSLNDVLAELPEEQGRAIVYMLALARRQASRLAARPGTWGTYIPAFGYTTNNRGDFQRDWATEISDWRSWLGGVFPNFSTTFTAANLAKTARWSSRTLGVLSGGGVIRVDESEIVVDLAAIHMQLNYLFNIAMGVGGSTANVRGRAFEEDVQAAIDSSSWSPTPALRRFRGKVTFSNGEKSDLDALGEKDGALLIVEAKSIPRTADYDRAERNILWNTSSNLRDYVVKLDERLNLLAQGATRQGLEISRYRRIHSILCIPGPLFVSDNACLEKTDLGLRRVATLDELRVAVL